MQRLVDWTSKAISLRSGGEQQSLPAVAVWQECQFGIDSEAGIR
jgi:hypothetical protein